MIGKKHALCKECFYFLGYDSSIGGDACLTISISQTGIVDLITGIGTKISEPVLCDKFNANGNCQYYEERNVFDYE